MVEIQRSGIHRMLVIDSPYLARRHVLRSLTIFYLPGPNARIARLFSDRSRSGGFS